MKAVILLAIVALSSAQYVYPGAYSGFGTHQLGYTGLGGYRAAYPGNYGYNGYYGAYPANNVVYPGYGLGARNVVATSAIAKPVAAASTTAGVIAPQVYSAAAAPAYAGYPGVGAATIPGAHGNSVYFASPGYQYQY